MTTIEQPETRTESSALSFVWLEITGRCQLECAHCYAGSGPNGGHGSMETADWVRVIDQAAAAGVRRVQFIGGEPTLHPELPLLVRHAVLRGLAVEVFSNLVHVRPEHWAVFELPGVRLATSWYSDDPEQHAAIVGRPTHARTLANVVEARRRGIALRAGVIDLGGGQRTGQAREQLVELGVPRVGSDRVRGLGRGEQLAGLADAFAGACAPDAEEPGGVVERACPPPAPRGRAGELCGRCGDGSAAVLPDGSVTPCVMARWAAAGSVHRSTLADATATMPEVRGELLAAGMPDRAGRGCKPDDDCSPDEDCYPKNCDPWM